MWTLSQFLKSDIKQLDADLQAKFSSTDCVEAGPAVSSASFRLQKNYMTWKTEK